MKTKEEVLQQKRVMEIVQQWMSEIVGHQVQQRDVKDMDSRERKGRK